MSNGFMFGIFVSMVMAAPVQAAGGPDWVEAMRQVHAKGHGQPGMLLHLGDSITYSMAYFEPPSSGLERQFASIRQLRPVVGSDDYQPRWDPSQ